MLNHVLFKVYGCEASKFMLIGIDMRNTNLLEVILKTINGFSELENTLLLSEVVLTYMAVNRFSILCLNTYINIFKFILFFSCNALIKWIAEIFKNCILAVYEQINPFDGFGQVMLEHFKKLGSPLKCIIKYPTLSSQIDRYKQNVTKKSIFLIVCYFIY